MTDTTTTRQTVLISYDSTGYPLLPATVPVMRVIRPAGGGGGPGRRRGIRSVLIVVVMLLVAAAAVRCSGVGPTESPESLVRSVFAALTAHDGQRLSELGWCDRSPLCTEDGLATGYQAPERFEIVSSGRGKDRRGITVRYTVGGTPAEETVGVVRQRTGMLGHRWSIVKLPGASLDVRTAAVDQVHVAGVIVAANPVEDTGGVLPRPYAPPGAYTVAIDGDVLFAATAVTAVVAGGADPPPTVVTPTLRPDLLPQIERQIRERITYCAGQQNLVPNAPQWQTMGERCPFRHYSQRTFTRSPTWTIERMPTVTLHVDDHAVISVRTTNPGVAVVRYQWSLSVIEPREWTDASGTEEFTVAGKVGVKDNAPAWIG